jgi:hypothetical protein
VNANEEAAFRRGSSPVQSESCWRTRQSRTIRLPRDAPRTTGSPNALYHPPKAKPEDTIPSAAFSAA